MTLQTIPFKTLKNLGFISIAGHIAVSYTHLDVYKRQQSYNYGGGFLDYVAGHGKKYTFELAESFAREKSGGKKVTYTNPVAVEKNGGWRYSYGNMFYVLLVSQRCV